MKYRLLEQKEKGENKGGSYWSDADFEKHLKLTSYQTTYCYLVNSYPPPQKVLEAGCGIGRWVIPLSERGYKVTGIEIESEAIDIINQHYRSENLTLVVGDIFYMPFPSKSFDIVISLGVIEHFESNELQTKAIQEHIRVLNDDGVFLVTVPHSSLLRLLLHVPFIKLISIVRYFKGIKEYFTEYRYSRCEIKNILKKNNLQIIDTVYDDLFTPYNFGLSVDYPINLFFRSKDGEQYKGNRLGNWIFRFLWRVHPSLISGGIGFICKKNECI